MAPVRLEIRARAAILVPGGLGLVGLSLALGGLDLRWWDLALVPMIALLAVWIRWDRRRKISRADRAAQTLPLDDRSAVNRRELLIGVPTVGLTALFFSFEPFLCFAWGLLFLTVAAVDLTELGWIESFEKANGATVVRVVGFHWKSPQFALAEPRPRAME